MFLVIIFTVVVVTSESIFAKQLAHHQSDANMRLIHNLNHGQNGHNIKSMDCSTFAKTKRNPVRIS